MSAVSLTKISIAALISCTLLIAPKVSSAQNSFKLWHGIEREVRYRPQGTDFVIKNGKRRFNRALYGTNTAFRIEAGDLPEFALYLPGMGGNLKFGLINGTQSKWLINADHIEARYRPGSMLYVVKDALLGKDSLQIQVLPGADDEQLIVKVRATETSATRLIWAFGGATGKKFSRDGDIGADPESSFYLKPEYCKGNQFDIDGNGFRLNFSGKALPENDRYELAHNNPDKSKGDIITKTVLYAQFPASTQVHLADANKQASPAELLNSKADGQPLVCGLIAPTTASLFWVIQNAKPLKNIAAPALFIQAEAKRAKLAARVKVYTPDSFINTVGGALSVAADGIWENPSYMHGAVAWRMRLPAWRGPYVADPMGWHDRAWTHFSSYAKSQVLEPASGKVVADTALHIARQQEKMGNAMFSSGYIARNPGGDIRPHHYDMNLVYIDALLNHFKWTGNLNEVTQLWPTIKRHLDWERRNFDADGDGLYDAYCAIWASDALQYSGGGVTHSSAYNYRSNNMAAYLAKLLGEDPAPYQQEAKRILDAINKQLWLPFSGSYAEYKDLLGLQLVHPSAGLWTVYHAIDSEVPDAFQAYQALRYIDNKIPHIPVVAKGLPGDNYLLSTTNWEPYDWSLNNVAMAENLHTALAYWQGSRPEDAFRLWRSAILESMYLGASPGNFQQLSFYDAVRGELYRDFADPIGMASRSLVEGLFGIQPDLLKGEVLFKPGLPAGWKYASLDIPDVRFDFKRTGNTDIYRIFPKFQKPAMVRLEIPARAVNVASVTVNGKPVKWASKANAVGGPVLTLTAGRLSSYNIKIIWKGGLVKVSEAQDGGSEFYDPQLALSAKGTNFGDHTVFKQIKQGAFTWWHPINFKTEDHRQTTKSDSRPIQVPANTKTETVDLKPFFNDVLTNIFKNKYISPRPQSVTLQLPWQGIGNWAYPLVTANIDDSGLRNAVRNGVFSIPQGVPFAVSPTEGRNIIFTSQWDNYPQKLDVPLNGRSSHVYLLMAGSTNPMQSRMTNGTVTVTYTDGTTSVLKLKNPENWWPIEQDCINDGFAFNTEAPPPLRVHLKTGLVTDNNKNFTSIKGFSTRAIDGGAATVLSLPLDNTKALRNLELRTLTNDVVIGLMAVTLVRN